MSQKYAKVESGEVVQGPQELPCQAQNCDGEWVTGFNCLGADCLKACNWLPVTYADLSDYQSYGEPVITDDSVTYPAEDWSDEDIISAKLAAGAVIVTALVQDKIDAYNETYNLAFADVHSCNDYAAHDGYSHQAFCSDIWDWSVELWEAARALQTDVLAGDREAPTETEFLAELPEYTGTE